MDLLDILLNCIRTGYVGSNLARNGATLSKLEGEDPSCTLPKGEFF